MGKPTGFVEYRREPTPMRPVAERLADWHEVQGDLAEEKTRIQAARGTWWV